MEPLDFGDREEEEALFLVRRGLAEDAPAGDVTTEVLLLLEATVSAVVRAREAGVVCGAPVATLVFRALDPAVRFEPLVGDGAAVVRGAAVAEIAGPAGAVLRGERLALNFLQRLSGIATATRSYVDALAGTSCRLLDTRKTTPGWRYLEKYAVRAGGGTNHRYNLSDFALIKDNHRAVLRARGAASFRDWIARLRQARPRIPVELEVDTLEEFDQALLARPDIILLDNFSLADLGEAAARARKLGADRPLLEASGGIDRETVRRVAESGVDRVAVGAITHSARALDIGLDALEASPAADGNPHGGE
jgi:nicotinate-nucleotide pyrophosphorylase (carboxylating)